MSDDDKVGKEEFRRILLDHIGFAKVNIGDIVLCQLPGLALKPEVDAIIAIVREAINEMAAHEKPKIIFLVASFPIRFWTLEELADIGLRPSPDFDRIASANESFNREYANLDEFQKKEIVDRLRREQDRPFVD